MQHNILYYYTILQYSMIWYSLIQYNTLYYDMSSLAIPDNTVQEDLPWLGPHSLPSSLYRRALLALFAPDGRGLRGSEQWFTRLWHLQRSNVLRIGWSNNLTIISSTYMSKVHLKQTPNYMCQTHNNYDCVMCWNVDYCNDNKIRTLLLQEGIGNETKNTKPIESKQNRPLVIDVVIACGDMARSARNLQHWMTLVVALSGMMM